MKVLHTSDLHFGHMFDGIDRSDEFEMFARWLDEMLTRTKIDILLISGDIYDHYHPSQEALRLYHTYLPLFARKVGKVVIVGGNHDSPRTLQITKGLLEERNIEIVTGSDEDYCRAIEHGGVGIFACSYLRNHILERIDPDFRKAYGRIYGEGLKNLGGDIKIAMGHVSLLNAQRAGSEREIYIGKIEGVGADTFEGFDYTALGHFHKSQSVGNVHYSGSPLAMNFKEDYPKYLHLLTIENEVELQKVEVPAFREFVSIKGSLEEIEECLKELDDHGNELKSFVQIELTTALQSPSLGRWKKEYKNLHILRIKTPAPKKGRTIAIGMDRALSPMEVAKRVLEDEGMEAKEKEALLAALEEIVGLEEGDENTQA